MVRTRIVVLLGAACVLGAGVRPASAQKTYEVKLKRAWVQSVANRATISASMTVRHTHSSANDVGRSGDDGDLHFSGVAPQIGLPFVAEIVNAGLAAQKPAITQMKAKKASGDAMNIAGAWRFWFEHPAAKQTQGGTNAFSPNNTNPDHSFEIHPVSSVDGIDIGGSFKMITGYTAYTADVAFPFFDACSLEVKATASGITLRSKKLKYNYVQFEIELASAPKQVTDGLIVFARVFGADDDDQAATGQRRMIFVEGSAAAAKVAGASGGDRFRVLGIPRLDLNRLLAAVKKNGTKQFTMALPYEMIIVGVR